MVEVWLQPQIIDWTEILLDSFEDLLGYQLISRVGDKKEQAIALFNADFVVVSHGIEADPILNYGNQVALDLWDMNWTNFTQTPSRLTAEPVNRAERSAMLQQAKTKGYIDNYRGVRIASNGQRFKIEQAIIWNLEDSLGHKCGQAATFSHWQTLEYSNPI